MNSNRKRKTQNAGFTRGDLLVVLAVLLLLAAVQLPSFGNAKSGSQLSTCHSNLRRLMQAWAMYADDNGGRLVPNNGSDPNHPGGTWAAGWMDFTSSYDNINVSYLVSSERNGRYGLLGPYLKRDASVFKCPADRSQVTIFGRLMSRVRSVSMNSWMGGEAWAGQTQFAVYRRIDEITRPEPAKALVILDEREDSNNDSAFYINMLTNLVDYPASYHEGGGSLAFADGHVEHRYWEDSRTVPILRRQEYLPVNEPMPDNPDLEFLRSMATALK